MITITNECDARTCDETDKMKLTIVCDGLSGKKQMVLCYECYDAFFGTDKPSQTKVKPSPIIKIYDIDIKECCTNNRSIYNCIECYNPAYYGGKPYNG